MPEQENTKFELSDDDLEGVTGGAYESNKCFCAVGGGGTDDVTGKTCACVGFGTGSKDNKGQRLECFGAGWIY